MIKNYIKIAFRSFWKHKLFTLINIIGLSIGISAALVIYLIVNFDLTFDKFHKDNDRIYRVASTFSWQGEKGYNGGICGPLAGAIKSQVPGIEVAAPFFTLSQPNVFVTGKKGVPVRFKSQDNVILAGTAYFKVFNYKWLAGESQNALDAPNQVVLTSEQAQKYFPALSYNQMIGKVITYDTIKTTVSGVVETLPANSDLTFHDFISYGTINSVKNLKDLIQDKNWGATMSSFQYFVKLDENTPAKSVERKLNDMYKKHNPPTAENEGRGTS